MNLEDLKKIDLKSIDISKASAMLLEKKEVLAQVVVVVLSVLILIGLWNSYREQTEQSRQEISQLNAKTGIVHSYEDGIKKMKSFLAALPKELDEEQFSSQIADYAAQNNVSIVSFSPGQKKSEGSSDILSARLVVRARSYKDFVQFIKTIEDAPYSLRIDSCSLSSVGGESVFGSEKKMDDDNMREAQIEMSSVSIKK